MKAVPPFASEAALCAAFIAALPEGWTAYPETGGFDIVLARPADGFQIGIEAKLKLNAKVIAQALEQGDYYRVDGPNPDCRAVLVPYGGNAELRPICDALGLTIIAMEAGWTKGRNGYWKNGNAMTMSPFRPTLPRTDRDWEHSDGWHERAPTMRVPLPDYVPDVQAGCAAPVALTHWKIKAIKIAITLEVRGYVTRSDFKHHKISMSTWTAGPGSWLVNNGKGAWGAGRMPDFRAQHPVNYEQIKADVADWILPAPPIQGSLL